MANTYTPPPTIEFFNSSFSAGLIYYNAQLPASSLTNSTSTTYSTLTCYTPNSVVVPSPGDYVVTWNAGAYGMLGQTRANFQFHCTHPSQVFTTTLNGSINNSVTTINVVSTSGFPTSGIIIIDNEQISYTGVTATSFTGCVRGFNVTQATSHINSSTVTYTLIIGEEMTNVHIHTSSIAYNATFSRKVTFPVSGTWTLTPKWKPDGGNIIIDSNTKYYTFTVLVHAINPVKSINQQLTQFVDSNYTLMTNVDANAWWGNLTNATVAGYQTSITNNSNAIISNTSNINALTQSVNDLTTNVSNLQNSVSGLTSLSTISGGIRIKP